MNWIPIDEYEPEIGKLVLVADNINDIISLGRFDYNEEGDEVEITMMYLSQITTDTCITHCMEIPHLPQECHD